MAFASEVVAAQRAFFRTGKTQPLAFRAESLRTLRHMLESRESDIFAALRADLGRSDFESYLGEIGLCLEEIGYTQKRLSSWVRPRRVRTPMTLWPASSHIYPDPYGVALIMAPWNYPFQLAIAPLLGAVASGNCVVLKPSEFAPNVSNLLTKLIGEHFDPGHVSVVEGALEVNKALLLEHFDVIFFTGSTPVGKIVMKAAAENLTPVILELGGKSPCIVDADANLDVASRRVAWGKFLNSGQTCVAPDYLLVHESVKAEFVGLLKDRVTDFFGEKPKESPDFSRIINDSHFDRLTGLFKDAPLAFGGGSDRDDCFIEPTVLDPVTWDDPVMQEEIFGPLLPVLEFKDLDGVIKTINDRPKPLALYYFGTNRESQERVLSQTSSGGSCVNDCIMHLLNSNLPFGGVGASGMGSYHGHSSFDAFTHYKSVLKKSNFLEYPLRYAPYAGKMKRLRFFVK